MISRLSIAAAIFATFATATLAIASERPTAARTAQAKAVPMQVIVLPRVEVVGTYAR